MKKITFLIILKSLILMTIAQDIEKIDFQPIIKGILDLFSDKYLKDIFIQKEKTSNINSSTLAPNNGTEKPTIIPSKIDLKPLNISEIVEGEVTSPPKIETSTLLLSAKGNQSKSKKESERKHPKKVIHIPNRDYYWGFKNGEYKKNYGDSSQEFDDDFYAVIPSTDEDDEEYNDESDTDDSNWSEDQEEEEEDEEEDEEEEEEEEEEDNTSESEDEPTSYEADEPSDEESESEPSLDEEESADAELNPVHPSNEDTSADIVPQQKRSAGPDGGDFTITKQRIGGRILIRVYKNPPTNK